MVGGEVKAKDWRAQERLDADLGGLFSTLENLTPEQRFQVATIFLKVDGLEIPKYSEKAFDDFKTEFEAGAADRPGVLDENVENIRKTLEGHGLTYLSTNYWSPAVANRQSAVAWDADFLLSPLRKRCAIAFFQITWEAEQRANAGRQIFWSLAQYLANPKHRPQTVQTVFGKVKPEIGSELQTDICIQIDDSDFGPPFASALATYVQQLAGRAPADDAQMLQDCLRNGRALKPAIWLKQLCDEYENVFEHAFTDIRNSSHAPELEKLTKEMAAKFNHEQLTPKRVAFLLAMQALWHKAFKGDVLYALPTVVNRQRSILTIGTEAGTNELWRLSNFGRSLFLNLLFLDYGMKEGARERRAYQSFVAHNLPKLVFAPATAELQVISREIGHGRSLSMEEAGEVAKRVRHLKTLFEHYESLMGRFRSVKNDPERPGLATRIENAIRFNEDIRNRLLEMFEVIRDRVLDKTLYEKLQIDIPPMPDLRFAADLEMVTEILVNLISNAVDAIDPRKLGDNFDWAHVSVHAKDEGDYIQFVVRDFGEGVPSEKIDELNARIQDFDNADKDRWNALVDNILNSQNAMKGSLEKSGLGLPLSIAYLRQLQWDSDYLKSGRLKFISATRAELDRGTEMTIAIPRGAPAEDHGAEREPTEVITSVQPSICLLTLNKSLAEERLAGTALVDDLVGSMNYDMAVIDGDLPSEHHPFSGLPTDALELMRLFRNPDRLQDLPPSVLALMALNEKRTNDNKPNAIIFLCEHQDPPVTQELFRAGADDICAPSAMNDHIAELLRNPPAPTNSRPTVSPSTNAQLPERRSRNVLVVENSRSVCLSLRKRLPFADLYFVGSELSGNKFSVDTDAALTAFEALNKEPGQIAAVISDLALDLKEEEAIRIGLQEPKALFGSSAATDWDTSYPAEAIREAIRCAHKMRGSAAKLGDHDLQIIFLSDFTRYNQIVAMIKQEFRDGKGYLALAKNQRGFENLELVMRQLLPKRKGLGK